MRKPVQILLLIAYLWLIADGLLGPLYAIFAEKIGGDILETAGAYAAYSIVSGVLHLFFGKIADKTKKAKRVMLGGYVLAGVSTLGYLFVMDAIGLFIVQIMLGVANAMSSSTWDGIYSKNVKNENAVTAWSFVEGGYAIIYGLSLIAGGVIITIFSFEVVFVLMAIVFFVASMVIYFVQEVQRPSYG